MLHNSVTLSSHHRASHRSSPNASMSSLPVSFTPSPPRPSLIHSLFYIQDMRSPPPPLFFSHRPLFHSVPEGDFCSLLGDEVTLVLLLNHYTALLLTRRCWILRCDWSEAARCVCRGFLHGLRKDLWSRRTMGNEYKHLAVRGYDDTAYVAVSEGVSGFRLCNRHKL